MEALRHEREDLEAENEDLKNYKDKLQKKYGRMRENFLKMGEENAQKNKKLQSATTTPITIKRVSKNKKKWIAKTQNISKNFSKGHST